ncbi:MAG: glycosyltransferase, partial [Lachnospiraceae bacterium]|nr:glycosyltransferase [Lachnospiraceae bacterium]
MAIHPAIVIIAYNRAEPLKRLLKSIERASYPDEGVTLIISIDAGGAKEVKTAADDFDWKHGEKKVIQRPEPLGLKKHVLLCSSYAMEYGSAIILEDDLYVARDFYYFAMAAIEHSEKGEDAGRIAGVSLYN